jgi:Protein of unknown function (DUF4435)
MTTFTRTKSGISNYPAFFQCDFMVYIEGKQESSDEREERPDIIYYKELLSVASNGKTPKIKCIGNKNSALDYAKFIRENCVSNSVVVVDKDLEGVTSSLINIYPVIRTKGYSWENELWSYNVIKSVTGLLTVNNMYAYNRIEKSFPLMAKRLKYLSLLDAVGQTNGVVILKKTSSQAGLAFQFPYLPSSEVSRVSSIFKRSELANCSVCRDLIRSANRLNPFEVVQGHFWSNVVMRMIASIYKDLTCEMAPTNGALLRLAFSVMKQDVETAVSSSVLEYYKNELIKFGI